MAGIPSQIVYGGCQKIRHVILPWQPFDNIGDYFHYIVHLVLRRR